MDTELKRLREARQRAFDRVTWWETHRYEVLFPIAIVCFGGGYGLGTLAKTYFGAPERTDVILALAALFAVGRYVDRRFNIAHVDRIDARIARLERERNTAKPRT
jgi:hypothetical protein